MSKLPPSRSAVLLVALPGLALLAGCGLEDYEQRLQRAQERVQRHKELAQKLGPPLELPLALLEAPPVEKGGPPGFVLFYRPPREIPSTCASPERPLAGLLYPYSRPRGDETAPASEEAPTALTDLYLALARKGPRQDFKTFVDDVLRGFPQVQENGGEQRRVIVPPGAEPRTFTYRSFSADRARYAAYFLERERTLAALVFRIEGKTPESLTPLLELSLQTLELDPAGAAQAQQTYQSQGGLLTPPPAP